MRLSTLGLLLCLSFGWHQGSILGCTIFKVSKGAVTLVGNNEDDNNGDTKVWFLAPEDGKFGCAFFGFGDGTPQGGMNDQGLFFDWVADNWAPDWKRDPNKRNYAGSVSELILEQARTVEEALQIYERYNETAFLKSRTLLVDKTGASAIVCWKNGALQILRGQGGFQGLGYGYETAASRLAKTSDSSLGLITSVLESCLQSGEYPTQYSNLYDLQTGEVWVYRFHAGKPAIRFNLQEELRKGHHFYNLPLLEEQVGRPIMIDFKTQPIGKIDPAIYPRSAGKYKIEPDYIFTITNENGRLYFDAHDAWHTALYPAEGTRFFIRSLDSYLLFKPGENGEIMEAVLHVRGKDVPAKRVD